jgi:hypothetical protein
MWFGFLAKARRSIRSLQAARFTTPSSVIWRQIAANKIETRVIRLNLVVFIGIAVAFTDPGAQRGRNN